MNYVRSPPPRHLNQNETLDSLNHWKNIFRNFYRRDSSFKQFLKSTCTWDFSQPNYAFTDTENETAEEIAESLTDFLNNLAGFLPHSYLTQKLLEETSCLQDCWNLVYEHYNVQVTPETLLDFESLEKEKTENYRQFYERLVQHVRLHLAQRGAKVESVTNAAADTMSISLLNMVALQWLRKCHPQLIKVVRKEYSVQLKKGEQLAALVPQIAPNVDSMINKYCKNFYHESESPDQHHHDDMDPQVKFIKRNGAFRNKAKRGGYNPSRSQEYLFCPGCFAVSKELKVAIDYKHRPNMCPRTRAVTRFLQGEVAIPDDEEDIQFEEISDKSEADGISSKDDEINNRIHLQNSREPASVRDDEISSRPTHFISTANPDIYNCHAVNIEPTLKNVRNQCFNISENIIHHVRNLEERKHLWSANPVRKESSPRLKASFKDNYFEPVIDEGSEINCISEDFLKLNCLKLSSTTCSASTADSSNMQVVGQTNENVIITALHERPVVWDLGKCIVVRNLSVEMLIGEPGKMDNKIITIPHLKKIKTEDIDGRITFLNYVNAGTSDRHLCMLKSSRVILPEDTILYTLPAYLENEQELAVSPVVDDYQEWITPAVLKVTSGKIEFTNNSHMCAFIKKNKPFADIVKIVDNSSKNSSSVNKILPPSTDNFHLQRQVALKNDEKYIDQVVIDPDDQLDIMWKNKFKDLCMEYADTINPHPGRYNGYYGEIDNSIDFISTPPPSVKARLPNYSADKLKLMAKLMDDLESMGVLAKPEDMGIVPAFVVPSLLMPKPEKGEWRLVSDFTPLNIHIRKFQTVNPTIQQAKSILAKYRYNIECDLSHYFFQGGMKKQDMQYLATPHPYKGMRVYCVEPQGLRNASEHAYERLARIFGDLCMNERMTRMADGLYIVADSVQELYDNFLEVLTRARNAGLTFKPKKIVIAPRETVLFGWRKTDDGWRPTDHTISPLSKAPEPGTVKQLRSFIGSYKQLSECIRNYAILLGPLEKAVAGKDSAEKVEWSKELSDSFMKAKIALSKIETVFTAKPSDKLDIFTDYSESARAIGGRMMITRRDENGVMRKLLGGNFSCKLNSHQKNWLPCEGESLGVRLVAKHFSPEIMENKNITTIHTDNLPTVHAWKRMKMGAFSTSARVASFLTGISSLRIEIVHKPGKKLLVSDYNSRHPNSCSSDKCKICQFAFDLGNIGNNAIPMVCSISVAEIENGTLKMPFTQRAAWAKVQAEDKIHKMLFKLIETSSAPEKKKTSGDFTRLKRLHNLYRNGLLKIDSDGLTTISSVDSMGNEHKAISVPYNFFPGLVNSLHIKLQHPSKAQMIKLISRYFYCSGQARIINDIVSNCELCRSLQELPKELFSESTEQTAVFGQNFSADILKKDGQLIFLCREKLSQFTTSKIIPDETADSLRDAIVAATVEFMPQSGAIVQVDCAPGLQTLAKESNMDGSVLKKLGIVIDMGRTLNINKNPIAENCVKEFHKERLRLNIPSGKISEIDRSLITKNMNSRVRERGFTPKEMALNRDQIDNRLKPVSDQELSAEQMKRRILKHNKPTPQKEPDIRVGDDVFVKNDKSKYRGREKYKVTKLFEINEERWAIIQKINEKFMSKEYEVKLTEIFLATRRNNGPESTVDNNSENSATKTTISKEECDARKYPVADILPRSKSKRRAANEARNRIHEIYNRFPSSQRVLVGKTESKDPSPYFWDLSEWIALCDIEEDSQEPSTINHTPPLEDNLVNRSNTGGESFLIPPTPSVNSLLRFQIAQLRDEAHTSSAMLQKFPPWDEPEVEWDHSPEFLVGDGHLTWDETNCMDDKLQSALKPRLLFQVSESPIESITSSASDDSTFFNDQRAAFNLNTPISRSDALRKPFCKAKLRPDPKPRCVDEVNGTSPVDANLAKSVYVNNLAHLEMHLEEASTDNLLSQEDNPRNEDSMDNSQLGRGYQQSQGRPRRSCKRPIDYKYLHSFGHQR